MASRLEDLFDLTRRVARAALRVIVSHRHQAPAYVAPVPTVPATPVLHEVLRESPLTGITRGHIGPVSVLLHPALVADTATVVWRWRIQCRCVGTYGEALHQARAKRDMREAAQRWAAYDVQ